MMQAAHTHTSTYARTHSITFLSDNLRNTLRDVIRENGLDPDKLIQNWVTIERGIRTWTESGHLTNIIVEFYRSGDREVTARWEFPISHSGSGVDDDMWLDRGYLLQLIAKARRPSSDSTYRVVLCTSAGSPAVNGFSDCTLLSTGQLSARQGGTVIATAHATAGATYWR